MVNNSKSLKAPCSDTLQACSRNWWPLPYRHQVDAGFCNDHSLYVSPFCFDDFGWKSFQRLASARQPDWHPISNPGRLPEPSIREGKLRDVSRLCQPRKQYSANKGFAEDLTEGKFSFPIVHSIRHSTNMRLLSMFGLTLQTFTHCALTDVLKQRPTDEATKAWAVAYMRDETQSFEYTRKVVLQLKEQALQEIGRHGGHKMLERILDSIAPSTVMTNGSGH
jgi:hypothetical protein